MPLFGFAGDDARHKVIVLLTTCFGRLGEVLAPRLSGLGLRGSQSAALAERASHGFVAPGELTRLGLSPRQAQGSSTRSATRT